VSTSTLNPTETAETLCGIVHRLFYTSPTFSAGLVKAEDGRCHRFRGGFYTAEGDRVTLVGAWVDDPKYGRQFDAERLSYELPDTPEGLARYLATGAAFKGIGPKMAERLVAEAGDGETLDRLLREDLGGLHARLRIPRGALETLRDEWIAHADENRVRTYLAGFGLTPHQMDVLLDRFGHGVVGVLRADPYQLIQYLDGYGFKRVDKIARRMGVPKDHSGRIEAAVRYSLTEAIGHGHTWIDGATLVEQAHDVLVLDTLDGLDQVRAGADRLLARGEIVCDGRAVTRPAIWEAERLVHAALRTHAWRTVAFPPGAADPDGLNPGQQEAYRTALSRGIAVVSGGAGVGKTYLVARVAKTLQAAGRTVALCAPTGKAAKRIEEVMRACGLGVEAKTVHRLLGYDGHTFHRESLSEAWQRESGDTDPACDTVIVDECFDYKQPVLTEDGWKPIGSLVNSRKRVRVWARNPVTGLLELKAVVRWLKRDAPASLLKIVAGRSNSTRSCRLIRCTPDHKILTPYGYRRAGDLRVGEEVIAKGHHLTDEQRSVLIGSLLGDAGLHRYRQRTSPQVTLVQGDDQYRYLEFKRQVFGPLAGTLQEGRSGYGGKAVWRLALNVTDDTYEIAQEMVISGRHPSGRRQWAPTNRFLEWLDTQALAIWYLDNGSLNFRTNADGTVSHFATIHSQRFNRETHQRLASHLRRQFGLRAKITNGSRGYLYLQFGKAATRRLLDLIRPYTPACMGYKVADKAGYEPEQVNQADTCTARIQSIAEVPPRGRHVYDLEVADHHNYVAGNIIVSNCSMVDVPLLAELFRRIDFARTRLILVGDHNQLPPVGPGNVLRDIIHHDLAPTTVLTQVVRQAGVLKANATAVLSGTVAPTEPNEAAWVVIDAFRDAGHIQTYLRDLVLERIPQRLGWDPVRDVQLITPTHKGPLGTRALNAMMQRLLHGEVDGRFTVGDKVIQTSNDYRLGVMNGTIGHVLAIEKGVCTIDFNGEGIKQVDGQKAANLQLAYALTAHKAQGSEFPCAVVLCHKSHYFADRNWLYTAVTRAAHVCILVGDRWGLRRAAKKNRVIRRRTLLGLWAKREGEPPT